MVADPSELVDATREAITEQLAVEYEPIPNGKIHLAAEYEGETLERADYSRKIFTEASIRGQFLNSVEESLHNRDGADAEKAKRELKEWFAQAADDYRQQERETLPPDARRILEGTQYPVEVHGGETTTWHVQLTFEGRTRELEFTAGEMVGSNPAVLREKIANKFFELVEIEEEEWDVICENWQDRKEVVGVVDETPEDTVADRMLETLGHNVTPVGDREKLGNSNEAAWFDGVNGTDSAVAAADAPILWVQDSLVVDQLKHIGKKITYKGQLIKTLNQRGELHGLEDDGRKRWPNPQGTERAKFWPFKPSALGVSRDDVGGDDDPAHSEVSA